MQFCFLSLSHVGTFLTMSVLLVISFENACITIAFHPYSSLKLFCKHFESLVYSQSEYTYNQSTIWNVRSTARWLLFCRVSAITSGCIDRVIHFIFLHWLHRCLAGWTAQSTGLDRRTPCAVSWLTGAEPGWSPCMTIPFYRPVSAFPNSDFWIPLPAICFSQLRLRSSSFPSLCHPWRSVSDVTSVPAKDQL